jgi:hypothetical protein
MIAILIPCLLAVLALPAAAQQFDPPFANTGVHQREGEVRATGPGYTARFDRHGFEFVPLLGAAQPRTMPLRTRLLAVRRGGQTVWAARDDGPAPIADGASVHLRHGGVTETYLVRGDGIEQRFVLAAPPGGEGDLVVRLALTTELALVAADPQRGLRYAAPRTGGVTIGAVTGVDAAGATAPGTIRVDGDCLEYVLPGAFVAQASYPLVVDPLFGAALPVGNATTGPDDAPEIAFDATTLHWLVVWRVAVSAVQAEVRAQRVSFGGALVGGQILVDDSTMVGQRPRVAGVQATDRFLVGVVHRSVSGMFASVSLQVRTVDAATGAVSNPLTVLSGLPVDFALGGDSRVGVLGTAENALVVAAWEDPFFGNTVVRATLVRVPAAGDPTVVAGPNPLPTQHDHHGQIAVTRHAGSVGRWLVAFGDSPTSSAPPYPRLSACLIDAAGGVCQGPWTLAQGQVAAPTVATRDGAAFAVAWEDAGTSRLQARSLHYGGTCAAGVASFGPALDPVQAVGFASAPALDFATDRFVLAWRQSTLLSPVHVRAKSLAPDSCVPCSAEYPVEASGSSQGQPAVAARWSGGVGQDDTALVAWVQGGTIRARRYEATGGGSHTLLGGACGAAGTVGYQGAPVLGDAGFALSLAAPAAPVLAAVVGLSDVSIPCGPCTLVPNLDIVLAGPGPHPIPIPCDPGWIGVQFWAQWLLFAPGGCPLLPDFALSVAQRFTIGD